MSAVRGSSRPALAGFTLALVCMMATACSPGGATPTAPDAGFCASNGYGVPTDASCVKGSCLVSGTGETCCSSVCPSCESEGLVSFNDAGVCPEGLCPSTYMTPELQCCDSEPTILPAGNYCTPSVDAGAPEASAGTGVRDSGVVEASDQ